MSPLLSDLSGGSPASLPVSPPGPSLWCWVSSEAEGCPRRPAVVSVVEHVCVREAREIRPGIVPGCSLKSIRISWPCDICIHRNLTALLPQHPSRQRDQLFNLYTYTHTHTYTHSNFLTPQGSSSTLFSPLPLIPMPAFPHLPQQVLPLALSSIPTSSPLQDLHSGGCAHPGQEFLHSLLS